MTSTETAVLDRWFSHRDAAAFKTILGRYSGMVYATCRRVLGNATEAEDVTQECFEALAQLSRSPGAHLGCWLHRVATNRAISRLRSEHRRQTRERQFSAQTAGHVDIAWNDIYEYVDEAIAELPDRFRIPVTAYFLENRLQTDIAAELGVTQSTVAYRINQGVERIGKALRRRGAIVPATLAALMLANLAEAAPAPLVASLGKLALAQSARVAATSIPKDALPRAIWLAKTKLALLGFAVMVVAGLVYLPSVHTVGGGADAVSGKSPEPQETLLSTTPSTSITYAFETPAPKESAPPVPRPAGAQGAILDPEGHPVPDASVTATLFSEIPESGVPPREEVASTTTSGDGVYAFDSLPAGRDLLFIVTHPEWAIGGGDVRAFSDHERRDHLDFTLRRAVTIKGVVVSNLDEPIAGATVFIRGVQDRKAFDPGVSVEASHLFAMAYWHSGAYIAKTATDARGAFVFTHIPEDAVLRKVGAEKEGYAPGWALSSDSQNKRDKMGNFQWNARDIEQPCGELRIVLPPSGGVTGKVVSATTHAPVADARVQIEGRIDFLLGPMSDASAAYDKSAQTDSNGAFAFNNAPRGDLNVFATKGNQRAPAARVSVATGFATENVILELSEEGCIEGHAYDLASGKPIPKLMLYYTQRIYSTFLEAWTDDNGFFSIKGLSAGTANLGPSMALPYVLSASRHPDMVHIGSWTAVVVPTQSGKATKDVALYCEPTQSDANRRPSVRGAVYYASGKVATNVTVSIQGRLDGKLTDEHGAYTLTQVNPGAITLRAIDEKNRLFGVVQTTVETGKDKQVDIRMTSSAPQISGTIVRKDGTPTRTAVQVLGLENGVAMDVTSNAEGAFAATLLPGRYAISPAVEGALFVPSPAQRDIELKEGEDLPGVDFTLETMTGALSGTVTYANGTPAKSMIVIARGKGIGAQARTDDSGKFFIHPIDGTDLSIDVMNPENDTLVLAHASSLAAGQDDIRIVLEEPGRLTGSIVAPNKKPGEFFRMDAHESDTEVNTWTEVAHGKLDLKIAPGKYFLRFTRGATKVEKEVTIEATVISGAATDLGEIKLPAS